MYRPAGTHPQTAPTVRAAHGWSQWWFWTVNFSQKLNFELLKFLKNQHYSASTQEIEYQADFWESLHLHFWRAQPPCRTCAEAVESRSSQNVVRRPMYVCTYVRAYVWMCVRVCSTAVESRASQNVVRHPIHEFVVSHMSHTFYSQGVLNRACHRMWLAAVNMNALCHVWRGHAMTRVNPHSLFAVVVQSSLSQNVVPCLIPECIVSCMNRTYHIPSQSAWSICSGSAVELVTECGSLPYVWMRCVIYE